MSQSYSPAIALDFHCMEHKLQATANIFGPPGGFATVDLTIAYAGPLDAKVKFYLRDTEYALALASAINGAAGAEAKVRYFHYEQQPEAQSTEQQS